MKIDTFVGMGFILFFLIGIVFFGMLFYFVPFFNHLSRLGKLGVWLSKSFAALSLIFVYTSVYPNRTEADIFKYFDDGKVFTQMAYDDPAAFTRVLLGTWTQSDLTHLNRMNYWFRSYDHGLSNDNRLVIRVNAVLNLITQGNYGLNLSVFLFLSLLGCYWIYLFLMNFTHFKLIAIICAFFIPSVLFWSSGILKEALLVFALGGFLYSLSTLTKGFNWKSVVLGILGLSLLMTLKIYILMALIPSLCFTIIYWKLKSFLKTSLATLGMLGGGYLMLLGLFPHWSLLSTLEGKQFDFIQMANAVNAGSQIWVIPMDGTLWTLLKLIPLGIGNVLIYPNIFMVKNAQSALAFLENLFIIVLIVGAVIGIIKSRSMSYWQWGMIGFGFIVLSLVGMTAPVVGAMVRYKSPILPFLVFGLYHCQWQQMRNSIEKNRWVIWLNMRL